MEQVTRWPDIAFEILRHDSAVYAAAEMWSDSVEPSVGDRPGRVRRPRTDGDRPGRGGWTHDVYRDAETESVPAVQRVLDGVGADQ